LTRRKKDDKSRQDYSHLLELDMKTRTFLLSLLAVGASFSQSALGSPPGPGELPSPLWVDLQDVAKYRSDLLPDASLIINAFNDDSAMFAPDGSFIIGGVELQNYPLADSDGKGVTYHNVTALMASQSAVSFFRFFSIHVTTDGTHRQIDEVQIQKDIPLSSAQFMINTGLIQRLVILNDIQDNIEIIYPLGVGGVDEGVIHAEVNSMLTPLFSGAKLKRATVTKARELPTYYRGLPFMPITNQRGLLTPIAFHISVLSDDDWAQRGPNYLVRGLESHGCMRLRKKDLMEMFTIVEQGGLDEIPVNVDLFAFNIGDDEVPSVTDGIPTELHPYPLTESYYERVKNAALPGQPPQDERDPLEHLVVLEDAPGQPNFSTLQGFSADELTDLKTFEGITEALPPMPKK
jgi:hypothetical protein